MFVFVSDYQACLRLGRLWQKPLHTIKVSLTSLNLLVQELFSQGDLEKNVYFVVRA